ncbi:gliding motility-associated ABC transporter permease subunit GldF [Ravibacter arvi]|uniref:Gliding motility-associated ABC transporter permease subunit GldF n=1 Tax=Ravibacter arvi TaxID=2051041 RepID=A0ABP8MDU3_9BACT
MFAIFSKEVSAFFGSVIAYVVITVFLIAVGLIVWVFPDSNVLDYGYADMGVFFNLTPFVLLFLVPAVTMRTIAEESKNGTLELLLTKPLNDLQLVLGKLLACWLLVTVTLLATVVYYFSLYQLGNPRGNIDGAAVAGSYIGLFLLSGALVAMGVWISALNDNQIVAFVLSVFVGFIWYMGFGALSDLLVSGPLSDLFGWLALDRQYLALGKGLIDSRNVIYLLSLIFFFISLTLLRIRRIRV